MTEFTTTHPTYESSQSTDEASIDRDVPPLYPSVQRAMDDLRRITAEHEEQTEVRHTHSGEPILTPDVISAWAKEEKFGNRVRGTFHNEDTYIYLKSCNLVENEKDIDETMAVARELTGRGAIHPDSQWGVFESENKFQLFVVSPKLEAWTLEDELDGAYDDRSSKPTRDFSHIEEWYQRIDPNFTPKQPIPEDSLLHYLNWTEASRPDNWGWDETGTLFPVDVEVIRPTKLMAHKNYEPWKPYESPVSSFDDDFEL